MKQEPKSESGGRGKFRSFLPHPLPALLLTPFFARPLTLVPRSLLLNRTETLATQASWFRKGSAAHSRTMQYLKRCKNSLQLFVIVLPTRKRWEKHANQRVKVTLRHAPVFLFALSLERRSKLVGCKTLSRVVNLRFIPVVSALCLSFSRQLCAAARGERETLLRKQVRAPRA